MPPRKRKSEAVDEDTDDEKLTVPLAQASKRGRQLNPIATAKAKAEPQLKFDLDWQGYGDIYGKEVYPIYYLHSAKLEGREKIAAFDIDGTIIVTKSGKNFAINNKDWTWFDKVVPEKLKELDKNGYRVVFITNQAGIEKGKSTFDDLRIKFNDIVSQIDIPVYIIISSGETHYRKPSPEMWTFLTENCANGVKIDNSKSFYCGDAAGRAKNWAPGKGKDFSCSDRMFAHNAGLKFQTPEEFFLGHKAVPFEWGSIDPNEVLKKASSKTSDPTVTYHDTKQEIVLLCGPPASGKSTFYRRYFQKHNYVHINRDTLQTPAKCLKAAESALNEGKSVVIDNTNPSSRSRAEYIDLAKRLKIDRIRCFIMDTHIDLCHHLNYVRQNLTKSKVRRIPDVGYNMYKSQFEEPALKEGFTKITKIDFIPKFESTDDEGVFKQWTS